MLKRFFTLLSIFLFNSILQSTSANANCDEQEKEILRLKEEISQMKIERKMMHEKCLDDGKNGSDFSNQFLTNSSWTQRAADEIQDSEPNCSALENEFSQFHIVIEESRKKNERLTEIIDHLLSYASENIKPKKVDEEEIQNDEDEQTEDLDAKERNLNFFDGLDGSENGDNQDEEDFEFVVESQGSGNTYPNDDVESLPRDEVVLEDELDQCQVELTNEKEEYEQLKDNCTVEIKLLKHELKKIDITNEIPRDCRKMLEVQKLSHELIELSEEFEMKNELVHHLEQQVREVQHEEQEVNKQGKNSIVVNYELKEEMGDLKIHNEVLRMGLSFKFLIHFCSNLNVFRTRDVKI